MLKRLVLLAASATLPLAVKSPTHYATPAVPCTGLISSAKAASRSSDELAQIAHDAMQNNGFYAPLKQALFAEDFCVPRPCRRPTVHG
jgi:hypothetical protein